MTQTEPTATELAAWKATAEAANAKYERDGVLEYPSAHPDTWLRLLDALDAAQARIRELEQETLDQASVINRLWDGDAARATLVALTEAGIALRNARGNAEMSGSVKDHAALMDAEEAFFAALASHGNAAQGTGAGGRNAPSDESNV